MKIIATDIVKKHINRWEPLKLLAGGAPDDEYEYEIEQLVDDILKSRDEIEFAEDIKDAFARTLNRYFNFDDCLRVAKKIWNELYESKTS